MIIRKDQVQADPNDENRAERRGAYELLRYSQAGGLTQFGAYVETLQPGSSSSDRHLARSGRWRLVRTDGTLVKSGKFSYASGSTHDEV